MMSVPNKALIPRVQALILAMMTIVLLLFTNWEGVWRSFGLNLVYREVVRARLTSAFPAEKILHILPLQDTDASAWAKAIFYVTIDDYAQAAALLNQHPKNYRHLALRAIAPPKSVLRETILLPPETVAQMFVTYLTSSEALSPEELIRFLIWQEQLEPALQTATYYLEELTRPSLYILRAHTYKQLGDLESAAQDYQQALKLQPNNARAQLALAQLAIEKEDLSTAFYWLQLAAEHAPNDLETLFILSQAHSLEKGSKEQASWTTLSEIPPEAAELMCVNADSLQDALKTPILTLDFDHGEEIENEWTWYTWIGRSKYNDALVWAGLDTKEGFAGTTSLRLQGLLFLPFNRELKPARAAIRFLDTYIDSSRVSNNAIVSFFYRTEMVNEDTLFFGSQLLRPTDGKWHQAFVRLDPINNKIPRKKTWVRLTGTGTVWVDNVQVFSLPQNHSEKKCQPL